MLLELIRRKLEEAKKPIDEYIVTGSLPTHSEYTLLCGKSRGLAMALQILQEIYKTEDDNDT